MVTGQCVINGLRKDTGSLVAVGVEPPLVLSGRKRDVRCKHA